MPNLSQIKRQRMMAFLSQMKEAHKDDDAMLIALGEIESELNAKKYGLVWEEHEEAVDVMMRTHIPVFSEVADKEITSVPGGAYNFLLEGDNLHSLKLLAKTHKGKIDVIYIDPPNAIKLTRNNQIAAIWEEGYREGTYMGEMRLSAMMGRGKLRSGRQGRSFRSKRGSMSRNQPRKVWQQR